jgi:hypothetical protein
MSWKHGSPTGCRVSKTKSAIAARVKPLIGDVPSPVERMLPAAAGSPLKVEELPGPLEHLPAERDGAAQTAGKPHCRRTR